MKRFIFLFISFTTITVAAQNTHAFFFGRTTGKLPFLEYGTGDDRLGGAKMTYLDTNILVKVIDSFKTDYKVQLSKNHSAYIDKQSIVIEPSLNSKTLSTGSWKVFGDSLFDYVSVSLNERLPYRSIQQINPSRVVVELFGVENKYQLVNTINFHQRNKKCLA
jgi:N-acetylmuramoyl-L-alanine amidase